MINLLGENKTMNDLVSVIIPVYNAEDRIESCIESIIKQTYSNIEIIVVNDGSTDYTKKKLEKNSKLSSRIHLFNIANRGVSGARNYGINHSVGNLITFVDADDLIDSDYVEYLIKLYSEFHTDIVSCQHRVRFENGKIIDNELNISESVWSAHDWCSDIMAGKQLDLSTVCKLYRRELFDDISFPEGKLFEDTATTYRLVMKSKYIGVGNKSKYSYVLRNNSITRSKFNVNYLQLIEATDNMVSNLMKIYPDLKVQGKLRKSWARISVLNLIIFSEKTHEYKELIKDIRANVLNCTEEIMSKYNSDNRLKVVVVFLKMGIVPYTGAIRIMKYLKRISKEK